MKKINDNSRVNYALFQKAVADIKDNDSRRNYRKAVDKFSKYCKEQGISKMYQLEKRGCNTVINAYSEHLQSKGYAAHTIHSYLAPVAKGMGISLKDVQHPLRLSSGLKRSRMPLANQQGKNEAKNGKFDRLTTFQKAVGIRRSELGRITGRDLVRDSSGHLCVHVVRGKGGKEQLQRILPQNEKLVASYFDGSSDKVFSRAELNNKIDLHAMRADHARECYDYYKSRLDSEPGYREKLQEELKDRFNQFHKPSEASYKHFCDSMQGEYKVRGENRIRAIENGRPLVYDKTALMATSVFELSHWRNDVTVINYLI